MLTNTRTVRVNWGDCDPAGIVFHPRYFEWFDASTALLFEAATGLKKRDLLEKYNGAGIALLESRGVFKVASQYGDDLTVISRISEFRRSSFFVEHRMMKGDVLAVEGLETRLWTVRDPDDPKRLKSAPMPPEIVEAFQRG